MSEAGNLISLNSTHTDDDSVEEASKVLSGNFSLRLEDEASLIRLSVCQYDMHRRQEGATYPTYQLPSILTRSVIAWIANTFSFH